jgi:hypothetical protein
MAWKAETSRFALDVVYLATLGSALVVSLAVYMWCVIVLSFTSSFGGVPPGLPF